MKPHERPTPEWLTPLEPLPGGEDLLRYDTFELIVACDAIKAEWLYSDGSKRSVSPDRVPKQNAALLRLRYLLHERARR